MRLFLGLLLSDSLFGCALAAGALVLPAVHPVATVAIGVVLAAFALGTAMLLWLTWARRVSAARERVLRDVTLITRLLPMVALVGSVGGFLVAFSGGIADVQARVLGASSGLAATGVGIVSTVVLMVQEHFVSR